MVQPVQQTVRSKIFTKKNGIRGLAIATLLIAVVVVVQIVKGAPSDLTSKQQDITLKAIRPGMSLKSGDTIKGTHETKKATTLFYVVSAQDGKRVLGAGVLLPNKQHQFSQALVFDAAQYKNQQGKLLIYVQDAKGKRLDSVETPVRFE